MPYKSLSHFVQSLEKAGELVRIKTFVDPVLEITEITDRVSKQPNGGKALLFENNGTEFPLLINSMGSQNRICMALGLDDLESAAKEIQKVLYSLRLPRVTLLDKITMIRSLKGLSLWMPHVHKGRGECQQVVREADLGIFPILKCWPEDGGRFITLPMVNTIDPITGIRNAGMYRMQVFSKNLTGMHWHRHKTGARHFEVYKKLGKNMPVTVTLGGDPVYTYAATAPLPDGIDEYGFAGFLRKKKVELVKSITNDLLIPSDVDIVIEGYVDTKEEYILEGPFGDHTGFYSLADWYPRFHVTCITHRKNAIYPATIVGIPPQEDAWIAKATERIFLAPLKLTMLPEIIDWNLPVEGVAHNIAIIKIEKTYPGQAFKVMNALWGAGQMMFNKIMIIVDSDVDINNYEAVFKAISCNVDPAHHINFQSGPYDVLDHAAGGSSFGGKMGIDATHKMTEEKPAKLPSSVIDLKSVELLPELSFAEVKSFKIFSSGVGSAAIVLGIKKDQAVQVKELVKKINQKLQGINYIVFVDPEVNISDLSLLIWICSANIDPLRDCFLIDPNNSNVIVVDATNKFIELKAQNRHWPNVILSNEETIEKINSIWNKLNISSFILSPSLKYRSLKKPGRAYVE